MLFVREWLRVHELERVQAFEFGVLNGESAIEIIRALRGPLKKFIGFVTFSGIPSLENLDAAQAESAPSFVSNQYVSYWGLVASDQKAKEETGGGCIEDFIQRSVRSDCEVEMVRGDFRASLASYRLDDSVPAFFFHVDCDIYSSSKAAIEWVAKVAIDGSWLQLDDYWCYKGHPDKGQRRALAEVVDDTTNLKISHYCNYAGFGAAFIVSRY